MIHRHKLAWYLCLGLVAVLAMQVPGTLAQRDDDYAFVRTLVDIHRQVSLNYADAPNEAKLREAAINGMLSELDPYSVYVPPARREDFDRMLEGSFRGVGIQLDQDEQTGEVEVVTPIDGSPAFKAGVMAGDVILKVNGESIEGLRLPEVVKKVAGKLGTPVTLTLRRVTGELLDLSMTREEIVVPTVIGYARDADNSWDYYVCDDPKVAYLRITQFTPETYEKLKGILQELLADGMKGLVLDLRFNPGGRLDQAVQIVDLFIDKGVIVRTKGRNRPEQVINATVPDTLPEFPMIVLVNEASASASEVVAGSLKDNRRALIVGEQSYGKGSVQELIGLDSNGGELKLTVAYYYLPSGRLVHRKKDATDWGVVPHIVVPMDPLAEQAAMQERYEQERFRKPVVKATTGAVTRDGVRLPDDTPAPATQPTDAQLQRAVDMMIALVVLKSDKIAAGDIPPTLATEASAATTSSTTRTPATRRSSTTTTTPAPSATTEPVD